ncbi:hypothetical protein [Novosphingobium humi]|uniref:Metal-dependent HD superfamily phosphohydrolase n=1 Tax=Novosphingobium humi TaxID=2282397 RepID=A0ABY7U1M6_9SPHN|nr:hypothetical protein [Novosphingobium humi]WCT79417.1 hypothetical protein PQ457_20710 [Novosphingobium humi]
MPDHPWLITAFDRLNIGGRTRAMIIDHHSEPHRHYHTLRHVDLMLRQIPDDHVMAPEMTAATLFHDIIYDPARADNEEQSKALFQSVANTFTPPGALDRLLVSTMIAATKGHHFRDSGTPGDEAVNLVLKADLSILWHDDPDIYAWYAAGIRQEYAFVPDEQYGRARAAILTGLRDDLLDSRQLVPAEADLLQRNIGWELQLLALAR